jgi:NAD(P)H-dependent FMN reductase
MSSPTMSATRILVLPGSLRADAVSTKIAHAARAHTSAVSVATGLDALPLSEDLDADPAPPAVAALRAQVAAAARVLVVSPAHNGSISAALKNAIDWLSRPRGTCALLGKPTALLVAGYSPNRVEPHLEQILGAAGAKVLPTADRALNLRTFDTRQPERAPAVQAALTLAIRALQAEGGSS